VATKGTEVAKNTLPVFVFSVPFVAILFLDEYDRFHLLRPKRPFISCVSQSTTLEIKMATKSTEGAKNTLPVFVLSVPFVATFFLDEYDRFHPLPSR
jgi:hypothetical protein